MQSLWLETAQTARKSDFHMYESGRGQPIRLAPSFARSGIPTACAHPLAGGCPSSAPLTSLRRGAVRA